MAERTGDPMFDKLIGEYLSQNSFDWWSADGFGPDGTFMGDTWTGEQLRQNATDYNGEYSPGDLSQMRDQDSAFGKCGDLARDFARFLSERGMPAELMGGNPEDMYHDIGEHEGGHAVTRVQMPTGTYMIDWTAAQYGYQEFPMVQKLLDDQGGWLRHW